MIISTEKEFTFYARITDFEGLKAASSYEFQDQCGFFINGKSIRIRATTVDSETTYELTVKTKTPDGHHLEHSAPATRAQFEVFKQTSEEGLRKMRYYYPVRKITVGDVVNPSADNPIVFEVDVFFNEDGSPNPWCKIDLEVQDLLKNLTGPHRLNVTLDNIPLGLTDVMTRYGADAQTHKKIDLLYETVFAKK